MTLQNSPDKTVLILGAKGRFGLAVAKAFAAAGWRVLGQRRPSAASAQTATHATPDEAGITWLDCDMANTADLAHAAGAAKVVVYAVSPVYTNRVWKAQAPALLGQGLHIARALGATFMFPGNVYNFGPTMPSVLTEATPQQAQTIKGQVRIAMEAQMRSSGVPCIVIRSGDFYGAGQGSWFDQAISKRIEKGEVTYPGPSDIATAWAYLPDLARTFVEVAQKRKQLANFEVLHFAGTSLSGAQWRDILNPIAQKQGWLAQGRSLQLKPMPWPIIRMGAWFNPVWAALMEMAYLWKTPHALDNGKLVALLGAEPHTPIALAAHAALADLGKLAK